MNSLSEIMNRTGCPAMPGDAPLEERNIEALEYVRSKWRSAKPEDIRALDADILRVRRDEQTCAECRGDGVCPLRHHPLILRAEDFRGGVVYVARAGQCGSPLALEAQKQSQAEDLLKASGLTPKQRKQAFESYITKESGAEISAAKGRAMLAAIDGEWLVLAGKRGTGKSHLAVAIMLDVMKRGTPALFRSVPEMLDELRQSNWDNTYHARMKQLREIPCLVLDDLGKERASTTDTGVEYLYQILDFRYRYEHQTIITTNAQDQNELAQWSHADYFVPLLSRLNEMGAWCSIRKAEDYRTKLAETRKSPPAA
jgi:DNA replication protein DnaC